MYSQCYHCVFLMHHLDVFEASWTTEEDSDIVKRVIDSVIKCSSWQVCEIDEVSCDAASEDSEEWVHWKHDSWYSRESAAFVHLRDHCDENTHSSHKAWCRHSWNTSERDSEN